MIDDFGFTIYDFFDPKKAQFAPSSDQKIVNPKS